MNKTHEEFMKEATHANSLPAQTCRALGPESQEDINMYALELEHKKAIAWTDKIMRENGIKKLTKEQEAKLQDVVYTADDVMEKEGEQNA